jgi:molecular chaperone DnaJ
MSIEIPMTSAALGTTVKVETLDGMQDVHIKSGILSGQTVVLKDLGITKLRGHGRGDLIVHVEVLTPSKLNKEQEELLEKLANARSEKPDQVKVHTNNEGTHKGFFSRVRDAFNS